MKKLKLHYSATQVMGLQAIIANSLPAYTATGIAAYWCQVHLTGMQHRLAQRHSSMRLAGRHKARLTLSAADCLALSLLAHGMPASVQQQMPYEYQLLHHTLVQAHQCFA